MPTPKLTFVKPTKDCRKQYIRGREVVRWGYFFDESRTQRFVYAITANCIAYKVPGEESIAEQTPQPRPGDAHLRRASWSTSPARQRAISKLMAMCRKDFEISHSNPQGDTKMAGREAEMVEQICQLRAALATAASMLEDVLDNGCPGKGRSQDDKESAEQWREDRYMAVKKAESVLEATAEYAGVIVQ